MDQLTPGEALTLALLLLAPLALGSWRVWFRLERVVTLVGAAAAIVVLAVGVTGLDPGRWFT